LSHVGVIADILWYEIKNHTINVEPGTFIIMPNHMHGILVLNDDEMDTAINSATDNDTAQKWTRSIQEKYYGLGPRDAYPGGEDQGQMSAWDVMSSIGLFQMDDGASVNPCYELGSPRFQKITIHLSKKYYGGNIFVIEAQNASRKNKYIHSAILNNKKLNSWKIPQKEIIKVGKLILEMRDYPGKQALTGQ